MNSRRDFAIAFLLTILLGLASRRYPNLFPASLGKYPGDALWAFMVFLGFGIIMPRCSPLKLSCYALLVSYLDEFSQLYQARWINSIRSTSVGHLILGSAFSWFDMVAYTVGIACGALFQKLVRDLRGL